MNFFYTVLESAAFGSNDLDAEHSGKKEVGDLSCYWQFSTDSKLKIKMIKNSYVGPVHIQVLIVWFKFFVCGKLSITCHILVRFRLPAGFEN